jgi:xylan 1,4-beta-xylosidase
MDQYKVNLQGAVSWSFEFEDQEWFASFRDLATHGVDKPVLNVFRMFGLMRGERVAVVSNGQMNVADIIEKGVRERNDVHAIASKDQNSIWVLVWNYHDDNILGSGSPIELTIDGLAKGEVLVNHYRVDDTFSNSFEKWKSMGKPQNVTTDQYVELERSGQLQVFTSPEWRTTEKGKTVLNFDLPRQGVSLLQFTW